MGHLAILLGQPAVLGELLAGVLLGNLHLVGVHGLGGIATDPGVDLFARIGVVVLLFEVGLESTIRDILRVGLSSFLVAVLGVLAPFALGWLVGAWLVPEHSWHTHAFLGATLCATSVGITARVLQDIGKSRGKEARIILGAAVVDDVLGLIILAAISGSIVAASQGATSSGVWPQLAITLKAVGFLAGSLLLGTLLTPRLFSGAARLRGSGVLIGVSLAFCFLLAHLAGVAGLASIVGASLVLEGEKVIGATTYSAVVIMWGATTTSGPLAEFRGRPFSVRASVTGRSGCAFDLEHLHFCLQSSVSGKSPGFIAARNDPVTGDDERDRIPSQGLPDRPGSGGPVHVLRKLAVGHGPSCRDFSDRFVHLSCKGARAVQVNDDVQKVLHIPVKMLLNFLDDPGNAGRRHACFATSGTSCNSRVGQALCCFGKLKERHRRRDAGSLRFFPGDPAGAQWRLEETICGLFHEDGSFHARLRTCRRFSRSVLKKHRVPVSLL